MLTSRAESPTLLRNWRVDWIVSNWNQVQSYNFGTASTGLAMILIASLALPRLSRLGRVLAIVFIGVGGYFAYRGFYWFIASMVAPESMTYHPAFTANPAHPDDWRWTIWPFILVLEVSLFRLYYHVFESRHAAGAVLMAAILASYIGAGFV